MGPLGIQEILLIALVALLVFEPEKIPEIARTAGRWVSLVRNTAEEFRQSVTKEIYHGDSKPGLPEESRSPAEPGGEKDAPSP
jgi:sec-independent protein translocase protein TatB